MRRFDLRARLVPVLGALAALLVVNLVVLMLVTRPRNQQARTVDATTGELAAAVEREQARVALLQERVEQMQRSREALERFFDEDLSTKSERLVALQREIYDIARTFQVEAAQLKFSHEPVEGTDLVRLAVNIPLSGGYNNLRQFIHKVESSELFLIIESVQLQEGERGGAMLNLNVRLATYFADDDRRDLRYRLEG
jgi:Tfp pilus assembly protein PilO